MVFPIGLRMFVYDEIYFRKRGTIKKQETYR